MSETRPDGAATTLRQFSTVANVPAARGRVFVLHAARQSHDLQTDVSLRAATLTTCSARKRGVMVKVEKGHFFRAALEIGHSGDNDALPYDLEAGFIKDKATDLAGLCLTLFQGVETGAFGKPATFMNRLAIVAERLLAPSGPRQRPRH